ncbi:sugar phosphate isomerase/epimerase family protein [Quadrisphaera oryzae]|uniref:sugar phosphate isomerase/epimerase family protein n=1 Tax=Quadrisphaera TaxID=317661 RepID=UPI0016443C0E|nr:sugar phosphate isomerase/epimerase [Quadrisphaera sp. RL12-1S]MBC3760237.1 sugar phosphate isomerase/epimerase [Quadrisphaera sp. RL12-1S]
MSLDAHRVICSTITLRHLPLQEALDTIAGLGFTQIDLGALPGVCDHVPYELDDAAVRAVAEVVTASGLGVVSVNGDVGDLNAVLDEAAQRSRDAHLEQLLTLAQTIGARALVLPNGRQDHAPVTDLDSDLERSAGQLVRAGAAAARHGLELWVEAPHHFRLAHDLQRTAALLAQLPPSIGVVCDVSHITASGATPREFLAAHAGRTRHVHLRDAEPGYIHHSIGRGQVDFADLVAALDETGYAGALALELETRDTADADRPAAALAAGELISDLLARTPAR